MGVLNKNTGLKLCSKCRIEKPEEAFYPKEGTLDGLRYRCKECEIADAVSRLKPLTPEQKERHRVADLKYYRNNKDKYREYREQNKEKEQKRRKLYRLKNKDKLKKKSHEYYLKKKQDLIWLEKRRASGRKRAKIYAKTHKEQLRITDNRCKANRRKNDIGYRLKVNLRNRVVKVLKGVNKSDTTMKLIGCSIEFLKQHLESQFREGMSWDNYGSGKGKWNIDHIIPCIHFNLIIREEQERCFNWKNLQPLWSIENSIKGAKLLEVA